MTRHPIFIEATSLGGRGHRYRVSFRDSILVDGSRVPGLDACRALLASGITGRLEVWRPGKSSPDMQLEIQEGAKLTVEEGDRQTPRFVRWRGREDASQNASLRSEGSARTRGNEFSALDVKPQEVIPGQSEAADRCLFGEASMGPMPIVAMQPIGELGAALL